MLTDTESTPPHSPSSPLSSTREEDDPSSPDTGYQSSPTLHSSATDRPHFPLTEARFAYEKAVRRAMRLEQALYDASELKVNQCRPAISF